ncbi:MAG: DUF2203 family protein [Planctomycetes bacterium]|nr:DUF2203 family protein [Planctomycetota bacterium]
MNLKQSLVVLGCAALCGIAFAQNQKPPTVAERLDVLERQSAELRKELASVKAAAAGTWAARARTPRRPAPWPTPWPNGPRPSPRAPRSSPACSTTPRPRASPSESTPIPGWRCFRGGATSPPSCRPTCPSPCRRPRPRRARAALPRNDPGGRASPGNRASRARSQGVDLGTRHGPQEFYPRAGALDLRIRELQLELERIGCSYKGWGFDLGLVDFPGLIAGENVLLCWRSDEPAVVWYHSAEGGFAGRKPIPEEQLE